MANMLWIVKWQREITKRMSLYSNSEWWNSLENSFLDFGSYVILSLLKHRYGGDVLEQVAKDAVHEGVGWADLI